MVEYSPKFASEEKATIHRDSVVLNTILFSFFFSVGHFSGRRVSSNSQHHSFTAGGRVDQWPEQRTDSRVSAGKYRYLLWTFFCCCLGGGGNMGENTFLFFFGGGGKEVSMCM